VATQVLSQEAGAARLRSSAVTQASWCFWVAGIAVYGFCAWHFSGGHLLNQTSRDLWQHLAALKALIEDPANPANPFVPGADGSRHFHPYWVLIASIARAAGWNAFQAIALGGYVTAAVLLAGIYTFGRAFFRSPWGPLALLAAMVLSWTLPISHTGYHSVETLIEGIAYPAVLLVALSLLLWALVLNALERPVLAWLAVPLVAFMFATHQLGAGIGLIAAGCFILFAPRGTLRARIGISAAIAGGLLLSCAWPYYNPFGLVVKTGNPTWSGGLDFYGPMMLVGAGVPSLIGLVGLARKPFRREALPVLAAFALYAAIFALGYAGPPIATRFLMPAVLMLQIGVAALLIALFRNWMDMPKGAQLGWFGAGVFILCAHGTLAWASLQHEYRDFHKEGSAYDAALALTAGIPDGEPVAAYDVAAWPVVATGQRALSVPWPEPGIHDLAERQSVAERLFDPRLSKEERIALARHWGVRTLIMDRHGPLRRRMPAGTLELLKAQSRATSAAGTFIRFDLL
jgi:hypothetical protein